MRRSLVKNLIFSGLFIITGLFILLPHSHQDAEAGLRNIDVPELTDESRILVDHNILLCNVFKDYRYNYRNDYRIIKQIKSDKVKRGESMYFILNRNGISNGDAYSILNQVKKFFNPKYIRIGSKYEITHNGKGEFEKLVFYRTPLDKIIVSGTRGKWSVIKEKVPVEVKVDAIAGPLKGSLYASILALGEKEYLVYEIVDIFQWDIDFFVDPREGDLFELIFEKLYVKGKFFSYGKILAIKYTGSQVGECYAYRYTYGKTTGYYKRNGDSVKSQFQKSPLKFTRISSGYTNRRYHPVLKIYRPHHGIDYAAPKGTPVKTVADGKIIHAGWKGGAGKAIIIQHKNGYRSSYGHLNGYARGIRKGKWVKQGTVIGYVGATGLATGPHLDFRMKRYGKWINPLKLKKIPSDPVPKKYKKDFYDTRDKYDMQLEEILKKKYNSPENSKPLQSKGKS